MQLQLIGFSAHRTAELCLNVGIAGFISRLGKSTYLFVSRREGSQTGLFHFLKHWLLIWDAGTTFDVFTVRYELSVEKY
jgi:hypothetical protein